LNLYGLIQLKTKSSLYLPYNTSINKNISDWKQYDLENLVLNERNLYEIEIDTSDATMMGTEHSSDIAGYVTSRF